MKFVVITLFFVLTSLTAVAQSSQENEPSADTAFTIVEEPAQFEGGTIENF